MSEPSGNGTGRDPRLPPELIPGPPGFAEYRGSIPLMDLPYVEGPSAEDFGWAVRNRELHEQYQGRVVAVHGRKVWGVGKDGDEAWEDARQKPGCPPVFQLNFVLMIGMPGPAATAAQGPDE